MLGAGVGLGVQVPAVHSLGWGVGVYRCIFQSLVFAPYTFASLVFSDSLRFGDTPVPK